MHYLLNFLLLSYTSEFKLFNNKSRITYYTFDLNNTQFNKKYLTKNMPCLVSYDKFRCNFYCIILSVYTLKFKIISKIFIRIIKPRSFLFCSVNESKVVFYFKHFKRRDFCAPRLLDVLLFFTLCNKKCLLENDILKIKKVYKKVI